MVETTNNDTMWWDDCNMCSKTDHYTVS